MKKHVFTFEQFDNLLKLLATGLLIQELNLGLDWNTYGDPGERRPKRRSKCGALRCWFGWYLHLHKNQELMKSCISHTAQDVVAHFGLDHAELNALFDEPDDESSWCGVHAYAELDERINELRCIIEEAHVCSWEEQE